MRISDWSSDLCSSDLVVPVAAAADPASGPMPPRQTARGIGQLDLTGGPIAKTLILFALPTLASNILQTLSSSVNSIWVGPFLCERALAATANANSIMFLIFATFFEFGRASRGARVFQ